MTFTIRRRANTKQDYQPTAGRRTPPAGCVIVLWIYWVGLATAYNPIVKKSFGVLTQYLGL